MELSNFISKSEKKAYESSLKLASKLDYFRALSFKVFFKLTIVRLIYQSRHKRIFIGYLLSSFIALPISILKPNILLVIGPLLYGYWHLITSYKYSSFLSCEKLAVSKKQSYILNGLLLISFLEILTVLSFKTLEFYYFPSGYIGLLITTIYFIFIFLKNGSSRINIRFIISVCLLFLFLFISWNYPLNFIAFTLFAHNWFAFIIWYKVSKNKNNKLVCILSSILFLSAHFIILSGLCDTYFQYLDTILNITDNRNYAWILAPWSDDQTILNRAITLYAYGISLHYYIWLKAIPENISRNNTPVSFKSTFQSTYESYGSIRTYLFLVFIVLAIIMWLFWIEIGSIIYFSLSNVHIWTELIMLLFAYSTLRGSKSSKVI